MNATTASAYELLFQTLRGQGRALSFPCDSEGHVDLDRLPERARSNYLYARVVVGNEFAWPVVRALTVH